MKLQLFPRMLVMRLSTIFSARKGSPRPPGAGEPVLGEAGLPDNRPPSLQLLLALLFFFVGPAVVRAQSIALPDALKAAVLRLDETRVYATLAPDAGALDDLLAPDCVYVHSNGIAQTKAQFIQALKTGAMKYLSLRYSAPPQVRLYGNSSAVLTGTAQLEVQLADGRVLKPTVVFTAFYVLLRERWQLASYHSTNAPPTAPAK